MLLEQVPQFLVFFPVSSAIWSWHITSATTCAGMPREASRRPDLFPCGLCRHCHSVLPLVHPEMVQEVELTWLYCTPNVILMTFGVFMMQRSHPPTESPAVLRPRQPFVALATAVGLLLHIIVLYSVFFDLLKGWKLSTPVSHPDAYHLLTLESTSLHGCCPASFWKIPCRIKHPCP